MGVFQRPNRLTMSGLQPASIALVAPVGRNDLAEYTDLSRPALLITSFKTLAIEAADRAV